MAASTLSIGNQGYELLELIEKDTLAQYDGPITSAPEVISGSVDTRSDIGVMSTGASTNIFGSYIGSPGPSIENLGLSNSSDSSSTTNIFGSVSELTAASGPSGDTLNIFGSATE